MGIQRPLVNLQKQYRGIEGDAFTGISSHFHSTYNAFHVSSEITSYLRFHISPCHTICVASQVFAQIQIHLLIQTL